MQLSSLISSPLIAPPTTPTKLLLPLQLTSSSYLIQALYPIFLQNPGTVDAVQKDFGKQHGNTSVWTIWVAMAECPSAY